MAILSHKRLGPQSSCLILTDTLLRLALLIIMYSTHTEKMEEHAMMIRVMYSDGRFDMVKPEMLDQLLVKHGVTSFKRSSGWAVVGRDPLRSRSLSDYRDVERRTSLAAA